MIGQTVAELLDQHVGLDIEGIDRLYLNLYQPLLQTGGGVVSFFKGHRGAQVASTPLMAPMTREFAAAVQTFAKREGIEMVHFEKGQRKDEETQRRLQTFSQTEGVLYIRCGPREMLDLPRHQAHQRTHWNQFPVAISLHRDVQSILFLCGR